MCSAWRPAVSRSPRRWLKRRSLDRRRLPLRLCSRAIEAMITRALATRESFHTHRSRQATAVRVTWQPDALPLLACLLCLLLWQSLVFRCVYLSPFSSIKSPLPYHRAQRETTLLCAKAQLFIPCGEVDRRPTLAPSHNCGTRRPAPVYCVTLRSFPLLEASRHERRSQVTNRKQPAGVPCPQTR
jgi:hypothetical protein